MSKNNEFLKKAKILHLASVDKSGMPHVVPVWYLYATKKIFIGTNTKTEKAKNVKNHKKVSFCVDVGVNAPGRKMSKGSRKKLNNFINEVDGFKSVKLITKKKAEFILKDGSIKIIDF